VIKGKQMKTLKKNWGKLTIFISTAGVGLLALYACVSAWSQTAPGLGITLTGTNQVSLVVTNGTNTASYQIYFTEFLNDTNYEWTLFTNGTTGQTNFAASLGDTEMGFFKAIINTNGGPFTPTVIIQSPVNGSILQ